ncbi:unnamed protein product [Ascophyllum nodosum]
MNALLSARAKRDSASLTTYSKVWTALVSCAEDVLDTGRGVIFPELGTVTFVVSRSRRGDERAGHAGCLFMANPKFLRTFSVVERHPPGRGPPLAPAVLISPARVSFAAGVNHDCARFTIASIVDEIGCRALSGANLRLPFGRIGSLVVNNRALRFAFGKKFGPRRVPPPPKDEYDNHVRRILAGLADARRQPRSPRSPLEAPRFRQDRPRISSSSAALVATDGRGCLARVAATSGGRARERGDVCPEAGVFLRPATSTRSVVSCGNRRGEIVGAGTSGRSRHGKLSTATTEPTGSCESSVRGRPSARGADTRSSSSLCCCSSSPLVYDPGFGATIPLGGRSTLAGSAAIVAGGQAVSAKRAQSVGGLAVAVAEPSPREVGMSSEKGGVSRPATMKKYHLPPFLALERSGSLALAAREGPEIVQRQARARFEKLRAANRLLDSKDDAEMRSRQTRNWKQHQLRDADDKRRRKDQLIALKAQIESKKQERELKRTSDLKAILPALGRAFPCRSGYGLYKEAAAARRNAWCRDLDAQVEHKRRLEAEKKQAKVDHELVWANNIKAAINAQRGRELRVRERERAIVHGALEEQVNDMMSAAEGEGEKRRRRTQTVILDKIAR